MSILFEQRESDSLYIETVTHGQTACDGSAIRPAENRWHMVVVRHNGPTRILVVGPWTTSGVVSYTAGAELIWIQFKLGVLMPHLPTRDFLNTEAVLPGAARRSFWLKGAAWQFPEHETVEVFVDRLVRQEVLVCDLVVHSVMQGQTQDISPRTLRHRFLRTTGLTQSHIRQVERAQQAAALLRQGASILDTVYETGYFDQPHLTRALKQYIGYTPAQLLRMSQPA